jgi:hypothetical protein
MPGGATGPGKPRFEAGAAMIAERIRAAVESLKIPHSASRLGHVTVSAGVAAMRPSVRHQGPQNLTAATDQALYVAKNGGRNRVAAFPGIAETLDIGGASLLQHGEDAAVQAGRVRPAPAAETNGSPGGLQFLFWRDVRNARLPRP